ncbi:MAG: CpXC domain-containing protein, partial [Anaerolineae bacterium]
MAHSYAQQATLTCPACGQPFDAAIWLTIDAAERPDLLDNIRDGSLHDLPCPHCGHDGRPAHPARFPRLAYVPQQPGEWAEGPLRPHRPTRRPRRSHFRL